MIKKAQLKFVALTMSILLVIFTVISLVTMHVLKNISNRNIDNALTNIVNTYNPATQGKIGPKSMLCVITHENEIIPISYDEDTFNVYEMESIFNTILSRPQNFGRISNVNYKIMVVNDDNVSIKLLVMIDVTDYLANLNDTSVRAILIFLIIYALLFVVVFLFSFTVFEPIKDSFMKQKQFVSNASHELKTPLTIISANTDVLMRKNNNDEWVNNIKEQTKRLEILINDMLEMAKMDENKPILNKEEFNLSDEIIQNTLPFDAVAFEKEKIINLDVTPNLTYFGDVQSVKKIVNILLDNAVKYTDEGGVISVKLIKKGSKIVLSVCNTGSLIDEKEAHKIFQRFYRADNSRSRQSGGSGLGLSIAKAIADVNKWKISATSKFGEYMIINVTF